MRPAAILGVALAAAAPWVLAFNNDGQTDILLRNQTSGANLAWFISGSTVIGAGELLNEPDPDWKVVGTGDFNNDGQLDVLWRNTASGQNRVWLMNGVQRLQEIYLLPVADTTWEIVGTGYFNTDNKIDILWRNNAGQGDVIWFMDGVEQVGSTYIEDPGDNNWKIVGTGDFNNDGHCDILWRNAVNGRNSVWYMTGTACTGQGCVWRLLGVEIDQVPDLTWQIAGTGYFDSDNHLDILWRRTLGGLSVWTMNGAVHTGTITLPEPGLDWQAVGTGDAKVDGDLDGLPDLWERIHFGNLAQTGKDDPDGDLLSNSEEYAAGTNPMVANSRNPSISDGRYLKVASWDGSTLAGLTTLTMGDGSITLGLTGAPEGVPYDIYWTPDLNQRWRLLYTGPADGGEVGASRTYTLIDPETPIAFFEAADARDSDGDGLPDGYEIMVTKTVVGNPDSGSQVPGFSGFANNGVPDGDEDFDGDGIPNRLEHILRTDPFVADNPLTFVGLQNGATLSGSQTLNTGIHGAWNASVEELALTATANGQPIPCFAFAIAADGTVQGQWETPCLANGSYVLQISCNAGDGTPAIGPPITVTLDNTIWFPDYDPICADAIRVNARSKHANGTWSLDVYANSLVYIGTLTGSIDANGLLTWARDTDPEPGWSLSLYNDAGELLPYQAYDLTLTTTAPAGWSGPGSANVTMVKRVEGWFKGMHTKFAVGYVQVFQPTTDAAQSLATHMQLVFDACNGRNRPGVAPPNSTTPMQLSTKADWDNLRTYLSWRAVKGDEEAWDTRNFYYMGHGSPGAIWSQGSKPGPFIGLTAEETSKTLLQNAGPGDAWGGWNFHPYRFVYLNGCKTAGGGWPGAFGIPNLEHMTARQFDLQGRRYRAFVGSPSTEIYRLGNVPNYDLITFSSQFITMWAEAREPQRTVREAIDAAKALAGPFSGADSLKVFGYEGLIWPDTVP